MAKQIINEHRHCLFKRLCILPVVFILVLSVPAYADIIYEPYDDFYQQHIDEC